MADCNKVEHVELPNCPVRLVVVYPDRAEVTRAVELTLDAGDHEITFDKISKSIQKDSVRVDGVGSASIVEVSFREIPVTKEQDNQDELKEEVADLEKEIAGIKDKKAVLASKTSRVSDQLSLLHKYADSLTASTKQTNKAVLAEEDTYKSFFNFLDTYEKESYDLEVELYQLKEQDKELTERLGEISKKLRSLKPKIIKDTDEPIKQPVLGVLLAVKEKGPITLLVSYLVQDASWTPKYDVRVSSEERVMEVGYFGMIQQSTGEDWNEAQLSLSTASPSVGGSAPELDTCRVSLIHFENQRSKDSFYGRNQQRGPGAVNSLWSASETSGLTARGSIALDGTNSLSNEMAEPQAEVTEGLSSSVFNIEAPATIPSQGSAHKVSIGTIPLKPSFEYETVPKLSQHAFLKARVRNESRYTLLAGPSNVFLDKAFVTKSTLPNVSPMEEFTCSLGTDPSVKVVYKPVNKYREESGIISVSVLFTYKQVTEITNHRNEIATVHFTDQIPLSKDDKLKVTLLEPTIAKVKAGQPNPNPNLNPVNHVIWSLDVQPKETKQVIVRYTVEYPKNKQIKGL